MNPTDNFDKSFETSVSGKEGGAPEIGSLVSHEELTEESFIEEIFSSMAWNG